MKLNKTVIKIAILCVAMQDCGMGATAPALASIMAAFPTVAPSLVMMISTIPALMLALVPPIYAKATEFLRKRSILYIAAVLFLVGGVGPAFFHDSIYTVLFFRFLLGIANGIVIPMAADLCVDFFEGQERNTMQGFVSAMTGVSGIVFQMLGGYLAGIRWDYCFYSYFTSIIFFLFAIIFLPEPDKQAKLAAQGPVVKTKVPGSVYVIAATFGFFFLFMYIVITNAAVVLLGEGIALPAQIGLAFAFLTVASFLTSTLFGPMFKALKFTLQPIAYVLGGLGLYICYISHTFWPFTMGIAIVGLGMGLIVPTTISKLTMLVPYSAATKVIGIAFFGMGIGGFIQPMVFQVIFNIFNQGPGRFPFIIGAVGMIVFAIVIYLVNKATPINLTPSDNIQA